MVPESSSVWWPALGAAEHGQEKAFTSREPLMYEFGESKRFTNERAPFSYMRTPGGQLLQDDRLGKLQSPPDFCRWNLWGGCMDGMILPNKIRYLQHFRVKIDFWGVGGGWPEKSWCVMDTRFVAFWVFFLWSSLKKWGRHLATGRLLCFGRWCSLACIYCLTILRTRGSLPNEKIIQSNLWWREIADSCSAYDFAWVFKRKKLRDSTKINYMNVSDLTSHGGTRHLVVEK